MEKNHWEPNGRLCTQDFPRLLWNPKIDYFLTRAQHWFLSFAQIYLVRENPHIFSNHILIYFSHVCIGLRSVIFLTAIMRATCLAYIILVNFVLLTMFGEQQQLWILIIQFSRFSFYFFPVIFCSQTPYICVLLLIIRRKKNDSELTGSKHSPK
jgi:hypothetical protein